MNSRRLLAGNVFLAMITIGVVTISPIGVKSLAGSYFRSGYCAGAAPCVPILPNMMVYPSAPACVARVIALVPPTPAAFSTTIGWPSVLAICAPMRRTIVSPGPPAANGTIKVIARSGKAAAAGIAPATNANAATPDLTMLIGFIVILLVLKCLGCLGTPDPVFATRDAQ